MLYEQFSYRLFSFFLKVVQTRVPGIRMLDQPYMTDLIEANSMGHEPNLIDIYSASWGPTDDGKTVDGPRNATMRAIVKGVNEVSLLHFVQVIFV